MAQTSSKITIHARVAAFWTAISHFGGAERYLSGVVACTAGEIGVGAH